MARHELFEEKTTTSLVPKRGSFAMNPPLPPQMYIAACVHEALAKYKWGVPALGKTKISNILKGGGRETVTFVVHAEIVTTSFERNRCCHFNKQFNPL